MAYLQEQLLEAQKKEHVLQNQLSQLTEENQKLLGQLAEHKSQEDCAVREERDLMLQLKKVVDMQRDQIRTLTHETRQKNKDTEVLQEQLDRFMKMNEDLRHKMSVLQAQLKSSLQRKTELEALLQEKQKENVTMSKTCVVAPGIPDSNMLLNDERIPSFLLCGAISAIIKQRKKIEAKMLGITESATSSSDEEDNTWMQTPGTDCVVSKPSDSIIRSLFGMWYSKPTADTEPWEIISPKEINQEQKLETSNEND
ncbi:hypothetical protein XELAEV_18011878mg [Xenopus laevis]|uniref:Uncharacterized protein n=1 Tax=Xenopus laevis TaxID=8355 RepID=A0A974DMP6_XENLA|nr:hypothetical protein XELAEV_18011878mg [Xenopus laevis]